MKNWKLLLPIPCAIALLAMVPQGQGTEDPAVADIISVVRMSELQYVDQQGKMSVVPSRNIVEIRMLDDAQLHGMRFELVYENGDYSQINAQAIHILKTGRDLMDVRLVRSRQARMRFPKLP